MCLSTGALAQTILPSNGASIVLPSTLPPTVNLRDNVDPASGAGTMGRLVGVQDGRLDFFSLKNNDIPGLQPTLHGGFGGHGLQLQLKW